MEGSGSGLFNRFVGSPTVNPLLSQAYQMDWSQIASTSFQPDQMITPLTALNVPMGPENFATHVEYPGMQGMYSGTQGLYSGTQGLYSGTQGLYSGAQGHYSGIQSGYIQTPEGYFVTPGVYSGIQEYAGIQGYMTPEAYIRSQGGVFRGQAGDFTVQESASASEEHNFSTQEQHHFGMQEHNFRIQEHDFTAQKDGYVTHEDQIITQRDGIVAEESGIARHEGSIATQEDGIVTQEDGIVTQEDGIAAQEGGITTQEGGIATQEGGIATQEGGIVTQESDNLTQEGGITAQESDILMQEADIEKLPVCFYDEVYMLMHAFGDVSSPLEESVSIMHNLLESQMIFLVRHCEDVMKLRDSNKISYEDVLFLMRRNKALLKRLLQYLYFQDLNGFLISGFAEYRGTTDIKGIPKGGNVHKCLEFLRTIEKSEGDLTYLLSSKKVYDPVLQNRLKRRYSILNSGTKEFVTYFESILRTSFSRCDPIAFKKWILDFSETCYDIDSFALLLLDFLAIETTAGLIEKVIYLRSRKQKEKVQSWPLFNFNSTVDDSDDEESEDDINPSLPEIDKYSVVPRKYLKRKLYVGNSENKKKKLYVENSENKKKKLCVENSENKKKKLYVENSENNNSGEGVFYQDTVLGALPKVVLLPDGSRPKVLPKDFIRCHGNPPLNLLVRKDSELEVIQKDPITPREIRNALIHYQRPQPMTVILNTKLPYSEKRKMRLICLAFPHEEFEEDA